jgi:glycosyltransferase involved in cell wall biosynthesis
MRIAFVSQPMDAVFSDQNSIGIWTYEISRQLGRDHDVRVYCRADTTDHRVAGVAFRGISTRTDLRLNRITKKLLTRNPPDQPYFGSWAFFFPYAAQVAMDLRSFHAEVIHLHNFSQFAPLIKRLNPRSGLVLHMHCEWLTQLDRSLIESRLRHVDGIAGCSGYITDAIANRFPAYADKCATFHNGVDPERFKPSSPEGASSAESRVRLLFVGRVSPEKGLHYLIDALPAVKSRVENITLDIVGSKRQLPHEYLAAFSEDSLSVELSAFYRNEDRTQYYGHLLEKIRALGLESCVTLHGHLPQSDLPEFYRRADILVNPSLSESFGMSLIEAMASGVPVVATDIGGMPEIVSCADVGAIIPPGDSGALAGAIVDLALDGEKRSTMGQNGRRQAMERYSWGGIAASLAPLYRTVRN